MERYFYSDTVSNFIASSNDEILGRLARANRHDLELTQSDAWGQQIEILKEILTEYEGVTFFEYAIPRMGKRIDVLLIIKNVLFVLEFKIGESEYLLSA